jgi:MFS family permease
MAQALSDGAKTDRIEMRHIYALIVLSGIFGINTVDRNMFGLLLPQIQQDIPMSDTVLGLLLGPAFVVVYSVAGVPLAWLADRTGRRGIIVIGLAFWSGVTAATGFAANVVHLLIARIFLGIGEASNLAPSSALIGDMFSERRRVMAMAVFTAGGPLAIMIFYPILGWVAANCGWRLAYPMMAIVGLIVAGLTLIFVREPKQTVTANRVEEPKEEQLTFGKAARTVFGSKRFLLLIIGGTMVGINYSALLAWLPTFFLRVHGMDAQATGVLLGTYKGLFGVVAAILGGLIVTWLMRFDLRWLAWAPAVFCAGMVPSQMMLLLADAPIWWQVGLAIETIMLACINPCLFALLVTLLAPKIRATGTALYLLIFNLVGQSLGPPLIGALNDGPFAYLGPNAIRYSLLTAPLVIAVGAVLLFLLSFMIDTKEAQHEGAVS